MGAAIGVVATEGARHGGREQFGLLSPLTFTGPCNTPEMAVGPACDATPKFGLHAAVLTTRDVVSTHLRALLPPRTSFRTHQVRPCAEYHENGDAAPSNSLCVKHASWDHNVAMFRAAQRGCKSSVPLLRLEDDACLGSDMEPAVARSIIAEGVALLQQGIGEMILLGSFHALLGTSISPHYHELRPIISRGQPGNRGWHAVLFSSTFMAKHANSTYEDVCHWPPNVDTRHKTASQLHLRGLEVDVDACFAKYAIGKTVRGLAPNVTVFRQCGEARIGQRYAVEH